VTAALGVIPFALVGVRLACAPLIIVAALLGWAGVVLAAVAAVALVTDYLDGAIARRLGTDTPRLRLMDSQVDTLFYFAAAFAMFQRFPDVWHAWRSGVGVLLVVEVGRMLFELRKFGRTAAYHMWSAKAWGVAMLLGFGEVTLTGRGGPLLAAAIGLGVLTNLEGFAASVLLRSWHHDVPSLWHAARLERPRQ
jgi:CDP-diacylglycerol--glycerol-3-phosphate 3-phosphatidyltransferase